MASGAGSDIPGDLEFSKSLDDGGRLPLRAGGFGFKDGASFPPRLLGLQQWEYRAFGSQPKF